MAAVVMTTQEIASIIVSFDPVAMGKICTWWKTHAELCRACILEQFANGFMLAEFDLDCFGVRDDNDRERTTDRLEFRLDRSMRRLDQETQLDEVSRFWFRTQLHIYIKVGLQPRGSNYSAGMAVWEFVDMCLKHHGIFYPSQWLAARSLAESQQFFPFAIRDLRRRVNLHKLADRAFVGARDMGCFRLGRSRFEVLDALIRVAAEDPATYCDRQLCGCRPDVDVCLTPAPSTDDVSPGDSDESDSHR